MPIGGIQGGPEKNATSYFHLSEAYTIDMCASLTQVAIIGGPSVVHWWKNQWPIGGTTGGPTLVTSDISPLAHASGLSVAHRWVTSGPLAGSASADAAGLPPVGH